MIVRTCRIAGNQRYSWIKNQRSWFVSRTRPCSPHLKTINWCRSTAFLGLEPHLRLEQRGHGGQDETEKSDHSASLGNFITPSTRTGFSVHTGSSFNRRGRDHSRFARR